MFVVASRYCRLVFKFFLFFALLHGAFETNTTPAVGHPLPNPRLRGEMLSLVASFSGISLTTNHLPLLRQCALSSPYHKMELTIASSCLPSPTFYLALPRIDLQLNEELRESHLLS